MKKSKIIKDFEVLIEQLEIAINNVNEKPVEIKRELEKWESEVSIDELRETLPFILSKVKDWYEKYKEFDDILRISLNDYGWVSKETSYIKKECALVDDLHSEVINHMVDRIGKHMNMEIKKGGKAND